MRICHIITRLIIGGAQENTLLTCRGLRDRGHQVWLLAGPQTGPEGSLHDEARDSGDFRIIPALRRAVHPLDDCRALRQLRSLLRGIQPDIVHTHSSKAGVLGRIAARQADCPHIVHTIHGMSFNRTQPALVRSAYRQAERYCGRFTHRIISVADAMTAQALAAGIGSPEQFVTVYSGMQTEWYDPARYNRRQIRERWGFSPNHIVIGTVARLFRNKGYEQLIPAIAAAGRANPDLRFVWVGDGAQRAMYERQLERLGIRQNVHLTGLVPPSDVPGLLTGMDMLVHTSQWEGLPRVAVQASLMRKPVISFDIDGTPEVVIPGRTGALVPLNDVQSLTKAILELAADHARREAFGAEARRLCLERFDHREMVSRIEDVYQQLLTG